MFTGIIQKTGRVVAVDRGSGAGRLRIDATPWDHPLEIGESMAVNGVCLTLVGIAGDALDFDVLEETFRRTNLVGKTTGMSVNLERALRVGDPLGGHIVSGHIDGTGTVTTIELRARDRVVGVECASDIIDTVVTKGSIALDGISLTVGELDASAFRVHIIPHTWDITAMSELRVGDAVNLECDMLGKYVKRYLQRCET